MIEPNKALHVRRSSRSALGSTKAVTRSGRNGRIVRSFVRAINAKDWNALEELVAPTFKRHSYAAGKPGIRSRTDLLAFLQAEYQTFPDAKETLKDLIVDGNKVAARHRFEGTQRGFMGPHPPSGRKMIADYIAIYRIERGKIVEAWAEWDNLTGLQQLGHQDKS